jgi:hypothetical protein
MTEKAFDDTLRRLTRTEPFIPFVVQFADGRRITVETPAVSFGGGAAGFLSDSAGLVGFSCDEVVAIAPASAEAAS